MGSAWIPHLSEQWGGRAWRRWVGRISWVTSSVGDAAAWDLVFPPLCVDCGQGLDSRPKPHLDLCGRCAGQLRQHATLPRCLGCGLPRSSELSSRLRCLECQRQAFRFDRVVALGLYRDHLRRAVIRMKQFHEFPLTAAVGRLLAQQLEDPLKADLPDVMVPIPKFWFKRVWRGTNTSEVLADTLGRYWGRPVAIGALRCRAATRKQSLLSRSERRRNLAGALQLGRRYDFNKANVLIVDDIMTTGATANEAARVLARAGARRIGVAVVARATPGREVLTWPPSSAGGQVLPRPAVSTDRTTLSG